MTEKEEQFARLIGGLDVNAEPNPEHREQLREQMLSAFADASRENMTLRSTWPSHRGIGYTGNAVVSYWRTLMSSRLTRYAAVAAVAAAIILGLTFIEGKDKKAGTAWAIEQTIQVLQNVRTVYVKATFSGAYMAHMAGQSQGDGKKRLEDIVRSMTYEGWATSDNGMDENKVRVDTYLLLRANDNGEPATMKLKNGNEDRSPTFSANEPVAIVVKRNNAVYQYTPDFKVLILEPDHVRLFHPWPGPTLQSLTEDSKKPNAKWQEEYGKDELTGRDSVFVKYVGKTLVKGLSDKNAGQNASFWYQFDLESKLPVHIKIWDNLNWEGPPDMVMEPVYNLDIPDDTFNFPISVKSLKVTDMCEKTPKSEKSFTIEVPGGTCKFPEIVEDTLKARAAQPPATQVEKQMESDPLRGLKARSEARAARDAQQPTSQSK